ncbi:MAG: hypothetical protein M0Q91_05235 [Methanoregula sp.]|nr:hypothetical protein [Methanoregula sp.]
MKVCWETVEPNNPYIQRLPEIDYLMSFPGGNRTAQRGDKLIAPGVIPYTSFNILF